MFDRGKSRSTQDFMGKMLKFSGHKGEDQDTMAENWPGPERSPNVASDEDRKRMNSFKEKS